MRITASELAGGPSSSCETIILRNKRHGEIKKFVWEYLRPLLGSKGPCR